MSYSQHGEDTRLLAFITQVESRDNVTIPRLVVEAGASDGTTNSNSRLLIEHGWDAVLIEPHPQSFRALEALPRDNSRVELVNKALTDKPGPGTTTLYLHREPGHSSLIPQPGTEGVTVQGESLERIVTASDKFRGGIGILSLDIEGMEMKILPDVRLLRPAILIIEANNWNAADEQYRELKGMYYLVARNSVNSIYYRRDLMQPGKRYVLKWKCR